MQAKYWFLLAVIFQFLDGLFTLYGINTFGLGLEIEGNPLIKSFLYSQGPIFGLTVVKLLGCLCIYGLWRGYKSKQVKQSKVSLCIIKIVNALYFFAIVEWIVAILIYGKLYK